MKYYLELYDKIGSEPADYFYDHVDPLVFNIYMSKYRIHNTKIFKSTINIRKKINEWYGND